jgi:hypothetical protein
MSDHDLSIDGARRYWSNVGGRISEGWELAIEWDDQTNPTRWRQLDAHNPEDQQLLRALGLAKS